MSSISVSSLQVKCCYLGKEKWKVKMKKPQLQWHAAATNYSKSQKYLVRNEFAVNPATYSTTVYTDIPLYETPQALFDEYLEDKPRVFNAMFPEKHSIQMLNNNQDEWRIKMVPFKFLALTVWPTIDFRLCCKSSGTDYPPHVPQHITKLLELHNTRWELQGLDILDPSQHFNLGVNGTLYPDRSGGKSRIKGTCEMNISVVFPPALTLIPEGFRDALVKQVVKEMGERMGQNVDGSLLADYRKFKKEREIR